MSQPLEPNDEGTVCCICRKGIVYGEDAVHGLYSGIEARHWDCTELAKADHKTVFEEFDATYKKAMRTLDTLRQRTRDCDD